MPFLAGGRAADREEACRSLDDAKATWTLMQTRGTPEDSADGLKLVEELHASCP